MKKQLEIVKHVNLVDEAIFLLYHWINKGDIREVKLKYSAETELDLESYNKRFDTIADIFQDVTEKLASKKEKFEYYFKEQFSQFSTYGSLAILWGFHNYNNRLLSYEECNSKMSEAQIVKAYADVINDEESANTPSEELQSLSDLIRFLEAAPGDKESKWEVIKIFNNRRYYYEEVYDLLSEVIELISKHSKEIGDLENEFYDYWNDFQKENNFMDAIDEKLNIKWKIDKETVIVPLLFMPYGISISISEQGDNAKDIIRINFMINKNFVIADQKITKDDVINIGKLFSDKSKIDIMEFISKKPYYGKEISNELNLSTATISYHVNSLLKIGFIKADLISNKVYYTLDRDRISNYLDDIKEYFEKL